MPIELLVGGLGRGPCCVCERKDAMWGVALEGLEVHVGSVRFVSAHASLNVKIASLVIGLLGALVFFVSG